MTAKKNPTCKLIIEAVSQYFDVTVAEITSTRAFQTLVYPRHLAMYLCLKHSSKNNAAIGRVLGGRDHSTVFSANKKIIDLLQVDDAVKSDCKALEKIIVSLTHCDNETLQKAILDFDVPAIARRALNAPSGRMDISVEELLAVLSYAAVGDEEITKFRSETLNPPVIQNTSNEELEIIKFARDVARAWEEKERCLDARNATNRRNVKTRSTCRPIIKSCHHLRKSKPKGKAT